MIRKLFMLPITKSFTFMTMTSSIPIVAISVMFVLWLMGVDSDVDQIQQQLVAASADGKVLPSEITAATSYTHILPYWLIGQIVWMVFTGIAVRRILSDTFNKATAQIVSDARAAAGGDLRIDPEVQFRNEYGEVQAGFKKMLASFRTTIARIEGAAGELRQAAAEMAHTSDEAGHAIGEVAQAISSISEGASHQVNLITRTSDVVAEIETSIRDTSEHAREAQRQSAETEQLTEEGVQRAAEVQEAMQEVRESSLATAQVVRSLGEKSRDIDQIVQAITDIAGQTNMLALNASIEAARAGDQGRGFANVAEEVRTLAEDAQESASEIAGLINEIQTQTGAAVSAMEDGVARVEEGFDTVNRNRQTFFDISSAVRALHESSAEIAGLADGIAGGAGQVRQQIEEVASVAEESSASTEEVSASTEETSAAAQQVSASAQRVAETAAALAELASRFELPESARTSRLSGDDKPEA
ncbi:MAG TPA: methyl-accepting chemotaxis protein [Solirubrobacterales bacterium]|jgi:methyl-accepting chemotaxis protein|nr:methyl-accepting chemotaxis protein [Solirubrobacterales bacterium]